MMTSSEPTRLFALSDRKTGERSRASLSDTLYRIGFGAIGWPWLLYSLWGGTKASKHRLHARLDLANDALPHLGSWKADTGFLHRIVDAIETLRPKNVVELGAGASSLVAGRALQLHGGGKLISFDQHEDFVTATRAWLASNGIEADLRHAPLGNRVGDWPGRWYQLRDLPDQIDLLIIDGPPWAVHPYVRGAAESLFDRIRPGGLVLLDDAARPGERIVARRWRERHPDFTFERVAGGTKGTLIGRKRATTATILAYSASPEPAVAGWRRAAAVLALLGAGWIAHDVLGDFTETAHAASFVEDASASFTTSLARARMGSQLESTRLDRAEIRRATGIVLPRIADNWRILDVQVYPASANMSVVLVMRTARNEPLALYARRAETPAEAMPLLERRHGSHLAYWESGPFAFALTGNIAADRLLAHAANLSRASPGSGEGWTGH